MPIHPVTGAKLGYKKPGKTLQGGATNNPRKKSGGSKSKPKKGY